MLLPLVISQRKYFLKRKSPFMPRPELINNTNPTTNLIINVDGPEPMHRTLIRILRQNSAVTSAAAPRLVDVLHDDGGLADGAAVGEHEHGDLAVHRVGGEESVALPRVEPLLHHLVPDLPAQRQRHPRPQRERAHPPSQQPHHSIAVRHRHGRSIDRAIAPMNLKFGASSCFADA
uniref:Uncharacterized protein n=1 Tax=Leersia perrieri TaxID=77586 RepID=A0A0D9XJC9_9ORYZ